MPAGLERAEREEEEGYPLHGGGQGPRSSGERAASGSRKRERAEHERHHESVVVAAAREVDGEQGVPANEGGGVSRAGPEPRGEQDERDHRRRGKPSVRPPSGIGRVADHGGMPLGGEREPRTVGGRCVAPLGAHEGIRGVLRVRARLVRVGVPVVHRANAAVVPVRVHVRGEQHRARERDELDRAG